MVVIHSFPETKVPLYNSNHELIGTVNANELIDVQIQIVENDLIGYYIVFNENEIAINSNGELEEWPKGMFDITQVLFSNLFHARKNKLNK